MRMKERLAAGCLCVVLLLGLPGCSQQSAPQQEINFVTVEDGSIQREQMMQLADFSYVLLQQTARLQDNNLLVSPLSAWLALSMTGQGAAGDTAQAFQSFFQDSDQQQQRLLAAWVMQKVGLEQGTARLKLANSIWYDDEISVCDDFLQTVQQYYQAQVKMVDLQDAGAVQAVNAWIANATEQRILHMLEEIDDDAVLLLINALTLDAQWQSPFDSTNTYEQPFYCADGTEKRLSFMHQQYEHGIYLQWQQGAGIVLPYDDSNLVLVALLPTEVSNYRQLLEQLSADWVEQLLSSGEACVVQLALPRFEMNSVLQLNDVCKAMGLGIAFDEQWADFSNMGSSPNGNVFIGRVLQNCQLRLDELGTQAAAATVVELKRESIVEVSENVVELQFDRPFVYLVLDRESQFPLFAGVYQGE